MKRGRSGTKLNRHQCPAVLCMAALFWNAVFPAEAAPAALASGSAVVYEQMSEESAPLGNLVQDGSFEYLGDMTAEDGSLWHAVAMSGGVSGYIRGDAGIRMLQTQQEYTENEETGGATAEMSAENGNNGAGESAENGTAGTEEAAEDEIAGTGENEEENGEEAAEETVLPQGIENNRAKAYAAEALGGRIKGWENEAAENAPEEQTVRDADRKFFGMDKTLVLCIIVAAFSAAGAFVFQKKLRKERGMQGRNIFPEMAVKGNTLRNKRKRKKSRRRRSRKHGKKQKGTLAGNRHE